MSKKPVIKYTNRDFDSIKSSLVEHAKRFYPDRYNDFNESSFGSMMFDSVAYVGDIMSYYIDFQANESFLETALQYDNVRRLSAQLGYKFYGRPAVYANLTFYILVPAAASGLGPDTTYMPILKKGSQFGSTSGVNFILQQDVNFNDDNVEIVASKFDTTTNKPTEYAIRSFGRVKSGNRYYKDITIGEFQRFLRIRVGPSVINEIESVFDSEGHQYYQVPCLTHDVIYKETTNPTAQSDGVPSILKPFAVARRFILEQDETGTYLRFGYGSDTEGIVEDVTDPTQVVLKQTGKNHITDDAFDPNKLLNSDKFGIAPSNTTLRIFYGGNAQSQISIAIGQLNTVSEAIMEFPNSSNTTTAPYLNVRESLECANDFAISEDTSLPSSDELKYRAYGIYAAQGRTVTRNDYEAYCYQMPPSLGGIKRANIVNDPGGTNRRLALYVISEDADGHLMNTKTVVKNNLKTWLSKNKMLNDGIDIFDAKIINVGFTYEAVIDPNLVSMTVLADVDERLRNLFKNKLNIAEPIYINKIYNTINKTVGVIDCVKVTMETKKGANYSTVSVDMEDLLSDKGTIVVCPKNCVLEIKYLDNDIKGTAV
ncbi:MAG: putative baseplate wedge protein [Prokaryotic dsDNA virus sp.]|nr:MAG: putative baseplate wedge protein [Prokaryotic dsDNA virus sp.]|tara:strand:- start:8902 stop:10692 length:1791 start_codon:yes stop_codon:yes gene_type:complete